MKRQKTNIFKKIWITVMVLLGVLALGAVVYFFFEKTRKIPLKPEQVTIAAYAGDTGLLIYVAQNRNYFRQNGLDVKIEDYEAGKLAVDALLAGQADVATASDFVFVSQKFEHPDLKTIGTVAIGDTINLIARKDKGIRTHSDLKGKKIGVTRKSSGEFTLGIYLLSFGFSMEDVEIVDLNPGEIIKAMVEGSVDAAMTWEPGIFKIQKSLGEGVIILPGQLDHRFYFILIFRDQWLKDHMEAARRLLKSIVEAEQYVKENPKAASAFAANRFKLGLDYMGYILPKHQFTVLLPQVLLLKLEDQARWRLRNHLSSANGTPNYLDSLVSDPIKSVKPEGLTLFR